jgi:hypothetical protein
MPDLCTNLTTCGSGEARLITIAGITIDAHHLSTAPLTDAERTRMYELILRHKGVPFLQLLNRVIHGDEATNVKIYSFFGPGAALTKTNIGTNYVNICVGANGERQVVDLTGCTQYRLLLHANLVGTGQWGARVVRDSDNTVLHESANLGAAGERELDTDWQPLPAAFLNQGLTFLRAQAKSTTGADDPVFRNLKLGLR